MPNISKDNTLELIKHKGFTIAKGYIDKERSVLKYEARTNRQLPRQKKQYETLQQAKDQCSRWKTSLDNRVREGLALSANQLDDAAQAFTKLKDNGFEGKSLQDVVGEWLVTQPTTSDKTVSQLREEYMQELDDFVKDKVISKRTVDGYRSKTMFLVRKFGHRTVRSLSGDEILEFLKWMQKNPPKPPKGIKQVEKWSRGSLESYASAFNAFFSYCVEVGQIIQSPLEQPSTKSQIKKKTKRGVSAPPTILTVDQAKALLREAWHLRWRRCLHCVVALNFCGLRPEAEMLKLSWDDIDLEEGVLEVRGHKTKREISARTLKLCDTSIEWFKYSQAILRGKINEMVMDLKEMEIQINSEEARTNKQGRKRILSGLRYQQKRLRGHLRKLSGQQLKSMLRNGRHIEEWIAEEPLKFSPNKWGDNWGNMRKDAGITKWKRDTTRHSAASYLWGKMYGEHDARLKLRAFLGHVDESMFQHYVQSGVDIRRNAEVYYGLTPEVVLSPEEYEVYQQELEKYGEYIV